MLDCKPYCEQSSHMYCIALQKCMRCPQPFTVSVAVVVVVAVV